MSNNGWFTMKDVLNDLEEVTGRRIRHFDNRFAVSGESPPPVNVPDEEDDFLLMHKDCVTKDTTRPEPDLVGIKHMLRMVNDYFDESMCDENENIKELKKEANTVLSISKLNPNVREFVPRDVPSTSNSTQESRAHTEESRSSEVSGAKEQKKESTDSLKASKRNAESIAAINSHANDLEYSVGCASLVCKDNMKMNKTDASHKTNNNGIDIKSNDISTLNSEEIKNMREKLKLKIKNTSRADCLLKKKEKNLAIVSLLKLYTETPTHSTVSKPVELMTPDYFKTVPEDNLKSESYHSGKFETKHEGQKSENNTNTLPNGISGKTKIMKSLNNVENAVSLSQELQESRLKPASPYTQKQDEKSDSPNPVTCKRKGTTSVSQSIDIEETPSSARHTDSSKISSDEITISVNKQCKSKEINLSSKLKHIKEVKQERNDAQYLLQEKSHLSQQANRSHPTSYLQEDKSNSTNHTPLDGVPEQERIDHSMSKEVKESIKKVNNWLEPKKRKPLILGPVTFKRKDNTSLAQNVDISESPSSGSVPDSLNISEKSSSAPTSNSFVPTSYAEELTKRYMEQSKVKQVRSEDIWTKLERELKEKDKVIKEKMNTEIQRCS